MELTPRPANKVDDKILQLADTHSPEEISFTLGGVVSPAAVAAQTQKLLKSKSWLSAAQEDALVTFRMRKILLELEGRYMDIENAGMRLKLLKEIGVRLDKRAAATSSDINMFYAAQAVQVGQTIELALHKTVEVLREAYPELTEATAREALKVALPAAAAEIEARTQDE